METHVSGKPIFDKQAESLLEVLRELGFELFWNKEYRAYEQIEKEIASCNALLAIVDETWQSSTWMASEVTWASGQAGAIHTSNQRMKPIPVFLYPVLEKEKWGWLNSHNHSIILDRDAHKAVEEVKRLLTQHR